MTVHVEGADAEALLKYMHNGVFCKECVFYNDYTCIRDQTLRVDDDFCSKGVIAKKSYANTED